MLLCVRKCGSCDDMILFSLAEIPVGPSGMYIYIYLCVCGYCIRFSYPQVAKKSTRGYLERRREKISGEGISLASFTD